jgi:hypothetical protein
MAGIDVKAVNQALAEIVRVRSHLLKLDYSNPEYDSHEERLHDLEDDFQENYGKYMEQILRQVHQCYCPESVVLIPIAYLGEGVYVKLKSDHQADARLQIAVNPLRIYLTLKGKKELVWKAQA